MKTLNISELISPSEFIQARQWLKDHKEFYGYSVELTSKQLKAYAVAGTWLSKNGWEIGFQWSWGVEDVTEVVNRECQGLDLTEQDFQRVLNAIQTTQGRINGIKLDPKMKGNDPVYGWY